jgi:DNA topoisomerase-3
MMICARLVSALSDRHVYAETAVTVECHGETFTAKGRTVTQNGWKTVEQAFLDTLKKPKNDGDKSLPELIEGQRFTAAASVREGFTQPPKHFTEDLLLSAMETAGAEDMPDDVERKGLGTPATRAGIIENLVKSALIERKDKQILPTTKGVNLIKILPDSVKSPLLTAEWENHLKRIERGEMSVNDFIISINRFVGDTVKTYNAPTEENKALFPSDRQAGEVVGKCPRCGGNVTETPKGYFCDNKACKMAFFKDNKFFASQKKTLTKEIVKTLLSEGRIFISGLVSAKTGKSYNATVILDDKGEGYPGFTMEFEPKGAKK